MERISFFITFLFILFLNSVFNLPSIQAQVQQQWVKKYNGSEVNKGDIGTAIVRDASGNIYVTGQVSGYGADLDYMTIKYNSSGVQQWNTTYHGPPDTSNNYADAIAVDAAGNVYVTGFSTGIGTYNDFATIKYNSSGVQLWVSRYNSSANSNDNGRAIAVDDSGNVYVTGESYGTASLYDFATVKYNSGGVQQWASRFNGPGNNTDEPTGLAIDTSGNVYVTGYSIQSNVTKYATVKYSSAGVQQWASIYSGTANQTSIAYAIAVDHQGFIYITGRSFQTGTSEDIVTIKYNPSTGDSVWVSKFNSGGNSPDEGYGMTIDRYDNIFVTGASNDLSQGTWGAAVIKYNSSGVQQWATVYTPSGRQASYGKKIKVDSSGNSYVGGYSLVYTSSLHTEDYLMAKFDSNGVFQWSDFYDGPGHDRDEGYGIALDNSGNSFITGLSYAGYISGSCDYATVKYNSSGTQQWVARYNNPINSDDYVTAMKSDNSGNIYIAGTSNGQASGNDIVLIKYNSAGDTLWVRRYNGSSNSNDNATCLDVDFSGNVYVGGGSWSPSFQLNKYVVLKYSPSGSLLWQSTYYGGGYANIPGSIAADGLGNVYVFGLAGSTNINYYLLIKYDQNGDTVWTRQLSNPARTTAKKVLVDKTGYIYLTGMSGFNIYTVKLNSAGDTLWSTVYNGFGNSTDQAGDMYVDNNGNVYVTGYARQSSSFGSEDYITIKYDSSGVQQWAKTYNGTGNYYDAALSLSVDTLGYSYVTGASYGLGTSCDYETIKYSPAGDTIWTSRYNGPGNSIDFGSSLEIDSVGNVFVTGGSKSGSRYNFVTLKYDTAGVPVWSIQYNAGSDSLYTNPMLHVDAEGNVYVTGSTLEYGTDYDFVLIKYSQLIGVSPIANKIPLQYTLYQNYPNPFNPSTTIKFDIPSGVKGEKQKVEIVIYDVLGKKVAELLNESLSPGTYKINWDATYYPSGVYFYRLSATGFSDTKKMVILK